MNFGSQPQVRLELLPNLHATDRRNWADYTPTAMGDTSPPVLLLRSAIPDPEARAPGSKLSRQEWCREGPDNYPIGVDPQYNRAIRLQGAERHVTLGDAHEESVPSFSAPFFQRAEPPSMALFNSEPLDYSGLAVKNTFLHFEDDSSSDEDGAFLVRKTKSAPQRNSANLQPLQQPSYLPVPQPVGFADCFHDGTALRGSSFLCEDAVQTGTDEVMRSFPSLGSVEHASGNCRPCAWFWKRQGCRNGADCRHCHLCPESELKQRKKEKIQALRHQERAYQLPA